MQPRSLQYIAQALGVPLVGPGGQATGICTDSRTLKAGDLFVALQGDRFDGHAFVEQALTQGAVAAVVNESYPTAEVTRLLRVKDTTAALAALAGTYRADFNLPVIAVAGSNGKTTTKECIASVLQELGPTLASQASFNNHIGVPLTLLRLEPGHQSAVLEVGTNHPGELAPLLNLVTPRIGVLTSIGREHLEFFGTVEGVAQEEGALGECLPEGGLLLVNGDSPCLEQIRARTRARVQTIGFNEGNDWVITSAEVARNGTSFEVAGTDSKFCGAYQINLFGRHQAINALFAVMVGRELGLDRAAIQRGLGSCPAPKMRLQLKTLHGIDILDDAYNANADSMAAGLDTLISFPCTGRRIAVLGSMAELGPETVPAHEEIGRKIAQGGVDVLITVGPLAAMTGKAAAQGGFKHVRHAENAAEAVKALSAFLASGDVVLVKASRSARLEEVIIGLSQELGGVEAVETKAAA